MATDVEKEERVYCLVSLIQYMFIYNHINPPPGSVLLHRAQLHSDNQLSLSGHILENVGLQPPQHVRPQQVMELFDLVFLGDVSKLFKEAL